MYCESCLFNTWPHLFGLKSEFSAAVLLSLWNTNMDVYEIFYSVVILWIFTCIKYTLNCLDWWFSFIYYLPQCRRSVSVPVWGMTRYKACAVIKDQGDIGPCEINVKLILDLPGARWSSDETTLGRAVTTSRQDEVFLDLGYSIPPTSI